MRAAVLFCAILALLAPLIEAWGSTNKDRVLLEKVSALTLEQGRMTTGRRSSPVPQLKCVGGSAGCSHSIQPRVVQCLNRGFDGYDVQWECKADLDSKYKFGRIQVSCEGYDHPDDPYILRGSCGLEYELDLTGQGEDYHRRSDYHDNYHYEDHYSRPYDYQQKRGWSWGGIIGLIVVGTILYWCLKSCCVGAASRSYGTTGTYAGSQTYSSPSSSGTTGGGGGGGFWTGAATGGLLGYFLGNRGGGYGGYGGYGPSWGGGYTRRYSGGYRAPRSSGWGFGGGSSRSSGGGGSSSRTTSGFGGTSRR